MLVLYPYKNALWALRPAKPLGVLSRHPCRNSKPLPLGKGLCMLGWLCVLQSLAAYTPGIRAGAILVGLPPLVPVGGYAPQPHFLITKKFFYRLLIYVFYRNIIYQCGGMELLLLRSGILFLAVLFCQCVKQILYIFA